MLTPKNRFAIGILKPDQIGIFIHLSQIFQKGNRDLSGLAKALEKIFFEEIQHVKGHIFGEIYASQEESGINVVIPIGLIK